MARVRGSGDSSHGSNFGDGENSVKRANLRGTDPGLNELASAFDYGRRCCGYQSSNAFVERFAIPGRFRYWDAPAPKPCPVTASDGPSASRELCADRLEECLDDGVQRSNVGFDPAQVQDTEKGEQSHDDEDDRGASVKGIVCIGCHRSSLQGMRAVSLSPVRVGMDRVCPRTLEGPHPVDDAAAATAMLPNDEMIVYDAIDEKAARSSRVVVPADEETGWPTAMDALVRERMPRKDSSCL